MIFKTIKVLKNERDVYKKKRDELVAQLYSHGHDDEIVKELKNINHCIQLVNKSIVDALDLACHTKGMSSNVH